MCAGARRVSARSAARRAARRAHCAASSRTRLPISAARARDAVPTASRVPQPPQPWRPWIAPSCARSATTSEYSRRSYRRSRSSWPRSASANGRWRAVPTHASAPEGGSGVHLAEEIGNASLGRPRRALGSSTTRRTQKRIDSSRRGPARRVVVRRRAAAFDAALASIRSSSSRRCSPSPCVM